MRDLATRMPLEPVVPAGASSSPDTASTLPIPATPPDPEPPARFLAPASDPAGAAARSIARRVRTFRNFRGEVPGASWTVNPTQVWSIRREERCLRTLEKAKLAYLPVSRELTTPVATPVQLTPEPIAGVSFVSAHLDREVEVSCELASRLPALAKLLKSHGVRSVLVNSSYREQPRTSFHTFGLALDIAAFQMQHELIEAGGPAREQNKAGGSAREQTLVVAKHFEPTPNAHTCDAQPASKEGRILLAIACDIAKSQLFSSVLTPNYNSGHRDHFHLDLRPDDPRFFLR